MVLVEPEYRHCQLQPDNATTRISNDKLKFRKEFIDKTLALATKLFYCLLSSIFCELRLYYRLPIVRLLKEKKQKKFPNFDGFTCIANTKQRKEKTIKN